MKPSSTPQERSQSDRDDVGSTPTLARAGSVPTERSPFRPSLMRASPGRLSDISKTLADGQHEQSDDESASNSDGVEAEDEDPGHRTARLEGKSSGRTTSEVTSEEEERLAEMRNAMNAKLLLQQRVRRTFGSAKPETVSTRVSPIKEEDGASSSPSLNATFASPPAATRTSSSLSTESTESTKTIRASVPATPAGTAPLRTPSYPFPYVPGTPRTWSSGFHQPFTSLSPTVTGMPSRQDDTPARNNSMLSADSTPGPDTSAFMPPGSALQSAVDPRFPTPNLYDLVLQLNAEPGLDQWWATVTNLMHDHFKAERATLVIPLDPTDIENVPWGLKATFSMSGPEEFVSHRTVLEQTFNARTPSRPDFVLREPSTDVSDVKPQKLHPERLRPGLAARHSYAGHGRETFNETQKAPARPPGPRRTVTHAAGVAGGIGPGRLPARRLPSTSTIRHGSFSELEFSSIAGGIDAGPYAEVFPTLRALDHEVRPLIEPGGVNRVLDRGRVVTVTRDYVPDSSNSSNGNSSGAVRDEFSSARPTPTAAPTPDVGKIFGNYRSVFASDNAPPMAKDYEEYEQHP